jgi:hypothetical protein
MVRHPADAVGRSCYDLTSALPFQLLALAGINGPELCSSSTTYSTCTLSFVHCLLQQVLRLRIPTHKFSVSSTHFFNLRKILWGPFPFNCLFRRSPKQGGGEGGNGEDLIDVDAQLPRDEAIPTQLAARLSLVSAGLWHQPKPH